MVVLSELFLSGLGLLSLVVMVFMVGMVGYFICYFLCYMCEDEEKECGWCWWVDGRDWFWLLLGVVMVLWVCFGFKGGKKWLMDFGINLRFGVVCGLV